MVWNYIYDLIPLSSAVIVHKRLKSIWFAQYSQITNLSHLIGLHANNGTVRHIPGILLTLHYNVLMPHYSKISCYGQQI
jgi:hypothetical protein